MAPRRCCMYRKRDVESMNKPVRVLGFLGALLLVVAGMAGCGAVAGGYQPNQLYCCGGKEVWLVDIDQARTDPAARLWTWTAADSPQ